MIADPANNDGYLSDVLTQHSAAGSDVSHDLVVSTKALELHFKEKYYVLRGAYETRIKKMSEMINTTCCSLLGDELIKEMKQDRVSSYFIPAHINEIIERHLDSDREVYINTLTEKLSHLESSLKLKIKEINQLRADKDSQNKYNEALKHEINNLKQNLRQTEAKNEELHHISNQRTLEIQSLEQSFHASARELQYISTLDEEENRLRSALQAKIANLTQDKSTLLSDKNALQNRIESLLYEIKTLKQEKSELEVAQTTQKTRLSTLLHQVESTLEQETQESNEAISSVFQQMKGMKSRLLEAVHREKHNNLLLTDEITTLSQKLKNTELELKRYKDENLTLHQSQKVTISELQQAHEKTHLLDSEITHLQSTLQALKTYISEVESQHKNELQNVAVSVREECTQEQRMMEQVKEMQKLQIENEALRQSTNSSSNVPAAVVRVSSSVSGGGLQQKLASMSLDQAVEELQLLPEINDIIHRLRHDRDTLLHNQQLTFNSQLTYLADKHKLDIATLQQQFATHKTGLQKQIEDKNHMLKEAHHAISKLKAMVKDNKAALEFQKQRCVHLEQQLFSHQLSPHSPQQSSVNGGTAVRRRQTMTNIEASRVGQQQSQLRAQSAPRQQTLQSPSSHGQAYSQQQQYKQQQYKQQQLQAHENSNVSFADDQYSQQQSFQQDHHHQREGSIASSSALIIHDHHSQNNTHTTTTAQDRSHSHSHHVVQPVHQQQQQQQLRHSQGQQRSAVVNMLLRDDENSHEQTQQVSARPPLSITSTSQAQQSHHPPRQHNSSSIASQMTSSRRQQQQQQQQPPSIISSLPVSSASSATAASSGANAVADSSFNSGIASSYQERNDAVLVEGPHSSTEANHVLTAALQEAQDAHDRCHYLEDIISSLQAKLNRAEQASKYLNRQRKVGLNLSFTEGLDPMSLASSSPAKSITRQQQQRQQQQQSADKKQRKLSVHKAANDLDHHNNDDLDDSAVTEEENDAAGNQDDSSNDDHGHDQHEQERFDEHKEQVAEHHEEETSSYNPTIDDEAPELSSLLHLQSQLHHTQAVNSTWEEKHAHTLQLLEISRREVLTERQTVHALKTRETRLFTLLTTVDKSYKIKLQELKRDLMIMRSAAMDCRIFAQNEAITTVSRLKLEFKSIFTDLLTSHEKQLQDQRVTMQTAHNHDLSILESRFIEQINLLNQRHSKELEKIHSELLTRTERALNASVTQDGFMVTSDIDYSPSHQPLSLLGQSQVMTSSVDISRMLSSNYRHSVNGTQGQDVGQGQGVQVGVQQGQGLPAYESVLRGVLQGLQDQDTITAETVSKVTALGKAHQEPSFAANAAARALVGEEIDRFVVELLQKKYQSSGSALTSPVGNSSSNNYR